MSLRGRRRIAACVALQLVSLLLRADIRLPAPAPPQADAQAGRVWRGGQASIALRGHHAASGSISFRIVRSPRHGKLSELRLLGDNRATILYTNDGARPAAPDDFSYVVWASGDQISSPAEVRILVEEAPPRLRVPARIEFGEIMAGEKETRQLAITNEGGDWLEGRLTVSNPWRLAASQYRVESAATEIIDVLFQPNEPRTFVGQITLTGADGRQSSVRLEGKATAPLSAEPSPLRLETRKEGGVEPGATVPPGSPIPATVPTPSPMRAGFSRKPTPALPAPIPSPTAQSLTTAFGQLSARRIDSSRWEVRWPAPKNPPAKYRIDERLLALDADGQLQTSWREIPVAKITIAGDTATAQIDQLNPRELHLLHVSALARDGTVEWESPLVALSPVGEPPSRGRFWLVIFGTALLALLLLRWRGSRVRA